MKKSKKSSRIVLMVLAILAVSSLVFVASQPPGNDIPTNSSCELSELNYYYRSDCSHCIDVSRDGSLEKLEQEFGVKVNKFEVVNWGMYGIYATPTFKAGGQEVKGYRSFDQLKSFLGC